MKSASSPPRGDIRIVFNQDTNSLAFLPLEPSGKEDLCDFVDNLAVNGVDIYVQDIYEAGQSLYNSEFCDRIDRCWIDQYMRPLGEKLEKAFELGVEPVDVWARRCHEKGRVREVGYGGLPAYTSCAFAPKTPSGELGKHTLALTLLQNASGASGRSSCRRSRSPSQPAGPIRERSCR